MKHQIHVSDIQAFLQCRRAWNWSSNLRQHLTTIQPYGPFYLGTVVHKIMEAWYDPVRYTGIVNNVFEDLRAQPNAIQEFIDFGRDMFDHYRTWQNADRSEFNDLNLNFLAVERDFRIPIYTPRGTPSSKFEFSGRVDGVIRHWSSNRLYLHEIKTCKSIDSRIEQLQFEIQPTAYMLAMSEVYGEEIAGVIYTLIRKKLPVEPDVLGNGTLSKNKAIDTTADCYLACVRRQHPGITAAEIKSIYGDILAHLLNQPNKFFRRHLVTRSQAQLSEMRAMLYNVARDMTNPRLQLYTNPGYFCNNCQFQMPCVAMSSGQSIDPILSQHYTRNTRLD